MSKEVMLLGLDLGGTKCAAVLGDATGRVCKRRQWPSQAHRGPEAMIARIIDEAATLCQGHASVAAAGVSIGGPLDLQQGVVLGAPNLPGWDQVPLRSILQERLGLPVRIEHDAAACALAEYHWGAGQGSDRMAYLTCGTGFGVGMVFDGKAYHGTAGRSAEIGHVRWRDEGPVAFGKQGCYEAFAAGSSLPRVAAWRFAGRWGEKPPEGPQLSQLAVEGDPEAREVLALNACAVGDACAMLADLLFLRTIVLGSMARYLGAFWLDQVRARFENQALPDAAHLCSIVPAALGERLQDCSALVVAAELHQHGGQA